MERRAHVKENKQITITERNFVGNEEKLIKPLCIITTIYDICICEVINTIYN